MFLDRVSHFGKKLEEQGKCSAPKKLKSLIEVIKVAHLKEQVVSFNMNFIFSPWRVRRQIYSFRKKIVRSGKDRSPKKVKLLIEVPCVAHLKVQVVSFNKILISSP